MFASPWGRGRSGDSQNLITQHQALPRIWQSRIIPAATRGIGLSICSLTPAAFSPVAPVQITIRVRQCGGAATAIGAVVPPASLACPWPINSAPRRGGPRQSLTRESHWPDPWPSRPHRRTPKGAPCSKKRRWPIASPGLHRYQQNAMLLATPRPTRAIKALVWAG